MLNSIVIHIVKCEVSIYLKVVMTEIDKQILESHQHSLVVASFMQQTRRECLNSVKGNFLSSVPSFQRRMRLLRSHDILYSYKNLNFVCGLIIYYSHYFNLEKELWNSRQIHQIPTNDQFSPERGVFYAPRHRGSVCS